MKTKTIMIGSLLLLITLFAASILVIQTTATVEATVRITPLMLSEEDGAPSEFRVNVKLPASSGYTPADIDPEKVAVEGIPMKTVEDWPKVTRNFFAFKVDGPSLYNLIWNKVGHVTPGIKVNVDVTVTGSFKDSTDDFAGTCTITFMTMHLDPPPPP
jgi:hypothetical protein